MNCDNWDYEKCKNKNKSDLVFCLKNGYTCRYCEQKGCRAFLNMIRDPVDNYIEHKDKIEEVLKSFTVVPRNKISTVDTNQWLYVSSANNF